MGVRASSGSGGILRRETNSRAATWLRRESLDVQVPIRAIVILQLCENAFTLLAGNSRIERNTLQAFQLSGLANLAGFRPIHDCYQGASWREADSVKVRLPVVHPSCRISTSTSVPAAMSNTPGDTAQQAFRTES